jgi:DNA-binding response OmpR family regulator
MKVVLIDDDPQILSVLGKLLKRRGHEVLTFDNPLSCPIYSSTLCPCSPDSICPDIIISDVDMPKVNGLKFIEMISQKGCKCRKLALISGKGLENDDLRRMTNLGTRFFAKPLDFSAFVEWLIRTEQINSLS